VGKIILWFDIQCTAALRFRFGKQAAAVQDVGAQPPQQGRQRIGGKALFDLRTRLLEPS
jgi:hypothetical protein